ncbi:SCP-like protein [Oesophagostomum dentatum]|uniref:SCP-like protein n=1 Tax=Oesophagostomum dentatum TaxID=61180 RepID=A0A0B1THB1_OESDE|nr:SCP-like protein [Oesophagostomum dentatum]
MHNRRRMWMAQGMIQKYNKNYLPKGADIIKLEVNCTLEEQAITKAESCLADSPPLDPGVSENVATVKLLGTRNKTMAIHKGVTSWWKSIRTKKENIGMKVWYRMRHKVPHDPFIRMAWGSTSQIGCHVKRCPNNYVVVCRYSPSDLVLNEAIYTPGTPCSMCPAEYPNCESSLCVA